MSCKELSTKDSQEWQELIPLGRSVFGSVQYALIYEKTTGYEARLFVWKNEELVVAYPFFLRPAAELHFAENLGRNLFDSITPEFTGPLVVRGGVGSSSSERKRFIEIFTDYCQNQGIIAEFAHLNPWNYNQGFVSKNCVIDDREIVYVDLSLSEEKLWNENFTHACRKNIKRAKREKIRVTTANQPEEIKEFHRIYFETMEKKQAIQKYYYPLEFFLAFIDQMPGNVRFATAEYEGRIVGSILYLYDDENVYSFLGGADYSYQHVRPTNAIVYDTILWAKNLGKKRLILGGGYKPNDGISRFKGSFSPLRKRFHVYRKVHLQNEYDQLCRRFDEHYGEPALPVSFFPKYRGQVEVDNREL